MDAKVNLVNYQGNELIWREGKAADPLPMKEPLKISIAGDIHAISDFLKHRVKDTPGYGLQLVDASKVIIVSNKNERYIVMLLDPENFYGTYITAKLEASDELKPFKINESVTFTREQLLKLVRFSRLYFNDKEIHAKLVDNLSKVTLKTETEMQQANDRRGNKKDSLDQKVNRPDGWIDEFVLSIQIFKGFAPTLIRVELCMDVTATGFSFWLESPELVEATDSAIDRIFADELAACSDFVVINK